MGALTPRVLSLSAAALVRIIIRPVLEASLGRRLGAKTARSWCADLFRDASDRGQIETNSGAAAKRLHVRKGFVDYPIAAEEEGELTSINVLRGLRRREASPVKTAKCRMEIVRESALPYPGGARSTQSPLWQ